MAPSGLHEYGALLDAVRGARWTARLRPRTTNVGAHQARRIGPNVEVTEYRPYRQGDDPRRLDWKLLARTDRAYVRLAPDIATSPTLLLLDASASMGAALGGETKWRQARMLCVGLAAVARGAGDPIGLAIAHGNGTRRLAPRARGDVVREMIRVVDDVTPAGAPPLAPLLDAMRGIERVVLVSDLLGDADELVTRAASLVCARGGGDRRAPARACRAIAGAGACGRGGSRERGAAPAVVARRRPCVRRGLHDVPSYDAQSLVGHWRALRGSGG